MSYFDYDYKFKPNEADANFDLFRTPFYDCVAGKISYGDPQMPLKIKEALQNIGVRINNVEMEHNSLELYPTVSINGTLDPNVRFTVSDFLRKTRTAIGYFINKIIFNPPATVILWGDGTKTVVKCGENDEFDPEKGLVIAITKKLLGNKGNYYNVIKNLLKEAEYQYDNYAEGEFTSDTPMVVVKKMRTITSRPAMQNVAKIDVAYFECPVCGDEILKSGARYCANCGQRLIWEEK